MECEHLRNSWSWHAPKRNKKTCQECGDVKEMSQQECWVHREEFEEPWKELGDQ